MADISKIKLPSGSTYDIVDKKSGYKVVSINRKVDSGVNIADITIGDTTTQLYAPQGGGAGTVTSVGVSNATNGGLSVSGSPVTSSGTITIGHSNVLSSAQTTQAVYPIKIDKNGHISAYGSAVTVEKVKNTKIDASNPAITYYLSGSQSSSTATEELVKNDTVSVSLAQISQSTNITELTLGKINSTGTTGCIRLCSTNGNNTLILPGSVSSFAQINLPDTTGTLALTSDIPTVPTNVSAFTNDAGYVTTDTKNTAGSTNSSSKIYLIGAQSQAANPQTYSNSNLYYNNGFYSREHTNHSDSYIEQTAGKVMISGVDTEYSMQSTVDVHTNYISLLCEMDDAQLGQAEFEFKVNTSDALMSIETTETLYTDIVALGWNSDVITT